MKFLHTADWHIGKKIEGRERYDEYRTVLDEICDVARTENVDLMIVAGDVYDSSFPSAEAETVFFEKIKKISEVCSVLIISGNHDDYVRLTAASPLMNISGVYVVGNGLPSLDCTKRGKCWPSASGKGYAVFENGAGERVFINMLPYPSETRFGEGVTGETFEEKFARWIGCGEEGKKEQDFASLPSIVVSHIFMSGGTKSADQAEIELGGSRLISESQIPECDYVALGHLHRWQQISKRPIYYSGAPMRFTFDEYGDDKFVNVFTLDKDGLKDLRKVKMMNIKKLARIEAATYDDAVKYLEINADAYVELTLTLDAPLGSVESRSLHSHDNLVSLKISGGAGDGNEESQAFSDTAKPSDIFREYYRQQYNGEEPSEELLELFLTLLEDDRP